MVSCLLNGCVKQILSPEEIAAQQNVLLQQKQNYEARLLKYINDHPDLRSPEQKRRDDEDNAKPNSYRNELIREGGRYQVNTRQAAPSPTGMSYEEEQARNADLQQQLQFNEARRNEH